jgi:hypothetical protein
MEPMRKILTRFTFIAGDCSFVRVAIEKEEIDVLEEYDSERTIILSHPDKENVKEERKIQE